MGRMHIRAHLHVCASGLNSQGVSREATVCVVCEKDKQEKCEIGFILVAALS